MEGHDETGRRRADVFRETPPVLRSQPARLTCQQHSRVLYQQVLGVDLSADGGDDGFDFAVALSM
jgi:hypothetical protein